MTAVILQGAHTPQLDGRPRLSSQTSKHFACLEFLIPHIPQPQGSKNQALWKNHTSASLFCPLGALASLCLRGHSSRGWVQAHEGPQEGIKMGRHSHSKGRCRLEGLGLLCVGSWSLAGIRDIEGCQGRSSYFCVFGGGHKVSRAPTKLYLPPSAARHWVDSAQRTAGGGFDNGRAVYRERHRKACTGGI